MDIGDLEALEILARLPDSTPLKASEAAVFLRVSKSTLDKMRRPGSSNPGPDYSQGGKEGAAGANQKVVYFKRDLIAWLEANRVSNTLQAANRKGQLGFVTLQDAVAEQAFWRNSDGKIAGLVDDTSIGLFFERIGKWEIDWLSPIDACSEPWTSLSEHRVMAGALTDVLKQAQAAIATGLEATCVATAIDEGGVPLIEGKQGGL